MDQLQSNQIMLMILKYYSMYELLIAYLQQF